MNLSFMNLPVYISDEEIIVGSEGHFTGTEVADGTRFCRFSEQVHPCYITQNSPRWRGRNTFQSFVTGKRKFIGSAFRRGMFLGTASN